MYSLAALHGKYEAGPPSAPPRSQKKFTSPHNAQSTFYTYYVMVSSDSLLAADFGKGQYTNGIMRFASGTV